MKDPPDPGESFLPGEIAASVEVFSPLEFAAPAAPAFATPSHTYPTPEPAPTHTIVNPPVLSVSEPVVQYESGPPVAQYVTVSTDSDCSGSTRSLKRNRHQHSCKLRKRRKRHAHDRETNCNCLESSSPKKSTVSEVEMTASPPHPTPTVTRQSYKSTDVAPFVIHVQKTESTPNSGTSMHPVAFGKFLEKNGIQNVVNGSVKQIGRNKFTIAFTNYVDANAFVVHKSLEKNRLKAFIPTSNVTRMGIIRGVPADWSPEEVMANISVPIGCGEIIKVRRLNFKQFINGSPEWKPSQTIVVTFDGQILPKRVFMCYNALSVDLYIYPTIQCYNCCRFGHTKLQCRSKPRCFKCGQDHTGDSCQISEDRASCCLCTGYHFATSKSCPEFVRQKEIKSTMSNSCLSYAEASKLHPQVNKSYADIVSSNSNKSYLTGKSNRNSQNMEVSSKTSHKKTVFLKPQTPPPLVKGYDQKAHQALINEYSIPAPSNGCALNPDKTDRQIDSEQSINDLIVALLSVLINKSNSNLPSNAAQLIEKCMHSIRNGEFS